METIVEDEEDWNELKDIDDYFSVDEDEDEDENDELCNEIGNSAKEESFDELSGYASNIRNKLKQHLSRVQTRTERSEYGAIVRLSSILSCGFKGRPTPPPPFGLTIFFSKSLFPGPYKTRRLYRPSIVH